ncbi:hypothetical protein [Paenibacillus harenae]|uniref:Uncharacterized protein n=1 Tax=Paenibacillus harenae TaxID=306543 RepID=A0ABT9U2A4_PAEHA|nr:hypothetical protein [Paenibacillus harenae]MDQ0112449.1 hypothetical protein [Paenibacillus harenae]
MIGNCFWFFIEREMTDFIKDLNFLSCLDESHRDYEDTWEWYEFGSIDQISNDIYINISRKHNWKQGIYKCPVRLKYENSGMEINEIGLSISNQLGLKVYYGQVIYEGGNDYSYKEKLNWG